VSYVVAAHDAVETAMPKMVRVLQSLTQ
jgi:hypothetical protein